MTEIVHVKSLDQFKSLVGSPKPTIVTAKADWDVACQKMAPIVQNFANATPQIQFISFDVDEQSDIAEELSITSLPIFFHYQSGQKVSQIIGAAPAKLQTLINNVTTTD